MNNQVLILDTATNILGSKERACRLPLMEYLADCMCNLCYERAWYAKLGGCIAIKFLFERMDMRCVYPCSERHLSLGGRFNLE